MNPEVEFAGIYLSSIVPTALLAFAGTTVLRLMAGRLRLYRWIWHPALFDTALFILVWAAIVALSLKV